MEPNEPTESKEPSEPTEPTETTESTEPTSSSNAMEKEKLSSDTQSKDQGWKEFLPLAAVMAKDNEIVHSNDSVTLGTTIYFN